MTGRPRIPRPARLRCCLLGAAALAVPVAAGRAASPPDPFYMGGDVSLLPFLESRGATFRDGGQVRPFEQILVNRGANLFRLRLFVNPNLNYDDPSNHGAIQNEAYTIALAQRLKATGADILLDLHYSDTWADPGSQSKPAAWASQNFATLQNTVRTYTRDTLARFRDAGVMPEMVQVGNETTHGMLFNDGRVVYTGTTQQQNQSWANFGTLLKSGIQGVRDVDAQTPGQHTDVAVHVDGGDVAGRAQYFFNQLTTVGNVPTSSYDVMGMSFYGTTSASLNNLDANLSHLAGNYAKKVMVLETNHAWKGASSGAWPSTAVGQRDFLVAVRDLVQELPNGRGKGVVWWYPESIQVPGTFMWQGGAIALFDDDTDGGGPDGHDALAALGAFSTSPAAWNRDGDGNWYDAMSWAGGVPMFAGNAATFGATISAPRTVTLNGPRSAAIVTFGGDHAYTLVGSTLTLDAVTGNAAITASGAARHVIDAPVVLGDHLEVVAAPVGVTLALTGPITATGRAITKSGAGSLELSKLQAAALNVNAGRIKMLPGAGASKATAVSVADGAVLDLSNNALVTSTPVGTFNTATGAYGGVAGLVQSGRNGGAWNGDGIVTTQSHANTGLTTLAVARASDTPHANSTLGGVSVSASDVLVMYTYAGDADLSGTLDSDDYFAIDSNFNLSRSVFGWTKGDFDYNGAIDSDDYFLIDSNWNNQILGDLSPSAAAQAHPVPEPSSLTLFALAAAAAANGRGRRRRQRSGRGCFSVVQATG